MNQRKFGINENIVVGITYPDTIGFKYEVLAIMPDKSYKCKKLVTNEIFYYNMFGKQISLLGSLSELLPN